MRNKDPDLLYGLKAIADALSIRLKQAEHLHESKQIPTFKLGSTVCSRKSSINRWLADCEAKARGGRS